MNSSEREESVRAAIRCGEDFQRHIEDARRLHDHCVADYARRGAAGFARLLGRLLRAGPGAAPANPKTIAH